ncbi:MAG: glycosyltransferase [bacterium]|nr:MAG: glycosyltransferase [bacterium]
MDLETIHVIGSRHSGGAERFFMRLVLAMKERGAGVSVIVRPGSFVSKEMGTAVRQFPVSMRNVRDPFSRWRISRLLRTREPDIVQTYMGRATRLTRVPEGVRTLQVARLGGFYNLDGYRHADAWIGNTRELRDYLVRHGFPAERVFYIRNFVEPAEPADPHTLAQARRRLGVPEDALIVVGVGRFIAKKGFDILIKAFSGLPQTVAGRPVHLVLVGSGDLDKDLRDLASGLGVAPRVHWTGWLSDPGVYYEMGHLFVCPSRHEPLGNVILEAWNHGIPVVTTETQGALELVKDGISGVIVPVEDPGPMRERMRELLKADPETLSLMVHEGKKALDSSYRKGIIVDEYVALYRKLLVMGRR